MSMALAAACLVSSCNKDVIKPLNSGMSEGDKRLEKRIQEFYGRMKSIQQGGAANKNAKTTGDVYISVDSAEFLIESTYNYYVAGTDDDSSEVIFNTLSFDVSLPNDSVLSESEVAGYMLQIKDSIMLVYDNVSYA